MADYSEFTMACPQCHHRYKVQVLTINEIEHCPLCGYTDKFWEFAKSQCDNNDKEITSRKDKYIES